MAKFWCKVCGQLLDPIDGAVVATCDSCGARQVLPIPLGNEYLEYYAELVILQQSEQFEKAEELFEHLILEGGADAALYWLGVLIDYKAVYIRENEGYTIRCGMAGETSVVEHESFQKVLHYASPAQRGIFEMDGRILEESRLEVLGKYSTEDADAELPLNRGFLCLEDGAWDAAEAQFDRVLSEEPDNALAYFGKMMVELQVHREGELSQTGTRLSETENYKNVLKYGDELLCERLKKYREAGILYQATKHGKCAETIDDWKHVKKLLMEIRGNERAGEYLALCDRKIRAIMVREAQLVMGCREAVNLGLTTATLGTRMVSANYYYDFDMSEKSKNKVQRKLTIPSSRVVAIFALIIMIILALIFTLSFFMGNDDESDQLQDQSQGYLDNSMTNNNIKDETRTLQSTSESSSSLSEAEMCVVGTMAFTLDSNGKVVCLNESYEDVTHEETQNGASFVINVAPYESDFSTWSDVTKLYNDPDGAMLFGVMENGTVSYDIFSSSKMNYEAKYKAVSSWMNVEELIWEDGNVKDPCLFALTKKGEIYASDDEIEKSVKNMIEPIMKQGFQIETLQVQNGTLHILTDDGSYVSVKYK